MGSKKNIISILMGEGMIFPDDQSSAEEFEKKHILKINNAKAKNFENPTDILKRGKVTSLNVDDKSSSKYLDQMAQAAREGKEIPSEMMKKMLLDRKNAKK